MTLTTSTLNRAELPTIADVIRAEVARESVRRGGVAVDRHDERVLDRVAGIVAANGARWRLEAETRYINTSEG